MSLAGGEQELVGSILRGAGVPRDGVLFVHAAFRRLGEDGLTVRRFIEALLAYMQGGTVVMPTMTWRNVNLTSPVFDELATPSHVGALAEAFRLQTATHRSIHPTHSVAAKGRLAEHLTSSHHLDDTPCSMRSPYGLARATKAYVLMIGVGLERCTAIHHAEEIAAAGIYLEPASHAQIYHCRDRHGIVHDVRLRRHIKLNRDFPQFAAPLRQNGYLTDAQIGSTPCLIFSQEALLDVVFDALARDPCAIIAPPGAPVIP
jgi:aminoglycoside 3-N-acetyltransferase